ncbi:hypothetical protein EJB05_10057, partial [Eragrostis curvula]
MASGGGGRGRKPRRGSRPKAKKRTRYLSLSKLIKVEVEIKGEVETPPRSPAEDAPAPPLWEDAEVKKEDGGQQQQVEPFALHHEASTLFAAVPAPSLSDILGASSAAGGADESPSPSTSPDGGVSGFHGGAEEDLARRALRGRERWVYCCSSSSSPSSSGSPCSSAASTGASARSLLLKLDYEEILTAWADRGPLYIGGGLAAPKAEPEMELDNVLVEVEEPPQHQPAAAAACVWSSPESVGSGRAESVRRYREKRRNRLFAKRIRYEVRRVNAVRRPRFKGRFIKEHEEDEI